MEVKNETQISSLGCMNLKLDLTRHGRQMPTMTAPSQGLGKGPLFPSPPKFLTNPAVHDSKEEKTRLTTFIHLQACISKRENLKNQKCQIKCHSWDYIILEQSRDWTN